MDEAMMDTTAPFEGTPLRQPAINANTEHDAALSLFRLIAKSENWWGGNAGVPTREELLACYADCVCAARGEPPVRASKPEADTGLAVETADTPVIGETTHHCASVYEATQDLAASPDPIEPEIVAPNDGVSLEA